MSSEPLAIGRLSLSRTNRDEKLTTTLLNGTLSVGSGEILFCYGEPWAVYNGDVYFPDVPKDSSTKTKGLTPTVVRQINAFHPEAAHVRCAPAQFDFILASTLITRVRALLGATTPNEVVERSNAIT